MPNKTLQKIDQEPTTRDILDAILDFSERMDKEFVDVRTEMNQGFADVRTELRGEMQSGLTTFRNEMSDGFTILRNEMHDGFTNVRSDIRKLWDQLAELKTDLDKLSKRTIEDSDVNSKDIIELQEKYKKFEIRLKKLETQKIRN